MLEIPQEFQEKYQNLGKLFFNHPIKKYSWFQTEATAQMVFHADSINDLRALLQNIPQSMPIFVIGAGSNILFASKPVSTCIIKLGKDFTQISHEGDIMQAGAGALDANCAQYALNLNLSGAEFMVGIPGSIGGAVVMNAGCFGGETAQILLSAEFMDRQGNIHILNNQDLNYAYRHSEIPKDYIVCRAKFGLKPANHGEILQKMQEIKQNRKNNQPERGRTGGSTFKNPENCDKKVWQLLDAVGLRGYKIGGAEFNEKHCNFILNTDNASSDDILKLINLAQKQVKAHFGINIESEIVII